MKFQINKIFNKKNIIALFCAFALLLAFSCQSAAPKPPKLKLPTNWVFAKNKTIFATGEANYAAFRMPSIIASGENIICFAEGRKSGLGDSGEIDIVYKKSTDSGKSWSPIKVVKSLSSYSLMTPIALYLESTKKIVLLYTASEASATKGELLKGQNPYGKKAFFIESDDFADNWSEEVDITDSLKPFNYSYIAFSGGRGIVVTLSNGRTRALFCGLVYDNEKECYKSAAFASDDNCKTFFVAGYGEANSSEICCDSDSEKIYFASRGLKPNFTEANSLFATISNSNEQKYNLSGLVQREDLPNGESASSLCFAKNNLLYFVAPVKSSREVLTLRRLGDDGIFEELLVLHKKQVAYSASCATDNGALNILYEQGNSMPYRKIVLATLTADDLQKLEEFSKAKKAAVEQYNKELEEYNKLISVAE